MNRKSTSPIPEPIVQLQRQLDQFRSTQPQRTKLPESLWQAAVELARQHGVYSGRAAAAAGLYGTEEAARRSSELRQKATKPAFVELIAPHPASLAECVIEFESSAGSKMRIQWKAPLSPDWASLLRAWREAER